MNSPQVANALGVLSRDTGLRAFRLLVQAGPEGCPADALARQLALEPTPMLVRLARLLLDGMVQAGPESGLACVPQENAEAPPAALAPLLQAGLVSRLQRGHQSVYAVAFDALQGLIAHLTENCCGRGAGTRRPGNSGPASMATAWGGGVPG